MVVGISAPNVDAPEKSHMQQVPLTAQAEFNSIARWNVKECPTGSHVHPQRTKHGILPHYFHSALRICRPSIPSLHRFKFLERQLTKQRSSEGRLHRWSSPPTWLKSPTRLSSKHLNAWQTSDKNDKNICQNCASQINRTSPISQTVSNNFKFLLTGPPVVQSTAVGLWRDMTRLVRSKQSVWRHKKNLNKQKHDENNSTHCPSKRKAFCITFMIILD